MKTEMNFGLQNKIVLVTGSSQGIGNSIAHALQQQGCKVIINGRTESKLKKCLKIMNNSTSYVVGDITDYNQCKKIVRYITKKYGKLDILVCNIGNGTTSKNENIDSYRKMFEINFYSSLNIIEACKKLLIKSKGNILCISSIAGIESTGASTSYSVAKAALNAYIRLISRHFSKYNIRINSIAPGNILFKGSVWEKKLQKKPKFVENLLEKEVPMKRLGNVEEVSNLVVFLSSDLSSFTTGATFVVDGGQIRSIF